MQEKAETTSQKMQRLPNPSAGTFLVQNEAKAANASRGFISPEKGSTSQLVEPFLHFFN